MINKIIDGICVALHSHFGDEYEIYTERIEQGLKEPCFSIVCLNPTIEQFVGNRYYRTNQFCIHYFPSSNGVSAECLSVLEGLFSALELITVDGDLCRGTNINAEIDGDMLHFFVNYDMFVYKQKEAIEPMGTLIQKTGVTR